MIGAHVRAALVLMSVLFPASQAAALDPIYVGAEFVLPGAPSAIATDGTNYLAVWPCGSAICSTRITAAGTLILPAIQHLVTDVGTPSQVRVAFDGANYLVVWSGPGATLNEIYAVRVSRDGAALGPPVSITAGAVVGDCAWGPWRPPLPVIDRSGPELIFTANRYVVLWRERLLDTDTYNPTVAYAGQIASEGPITTARYSIECAVNPPGPGGSSFGPTVSTTQFGLTHLSVYMSSSVIDFSGHTWLELHSNVGIEPRFALSSTGANHLFAFRLHDPYAFYPNVIDLGSPRTALVAALGSAVSTQLLRLSYTGDSLIAAYDGTNHLVLWTEGESTVAMRVTPAGEFADSAVQAMPDFRGASALVSNGRGTLLLGAGPSARFIVTDITSAAVDVLAAAAYSAESLDGAEFRNAHQQKALLNKIGEAGQLAGAGLYVDALVELTGALNKVDGCAQKVAPDANDWVTSCTAQGDVYRALSWVMELLEAKQLGTVVASQ